MKKIYVVNKTHLDVGFTDLGKNVLEKYVNEYIPNAINTAEELNKNGEKFVWTTGSFLIKYFLKTADDEKVEKLKKAIAQGYVRWHAIPMTFHTELISHELAEYMFSISKELDEEFGVTTTSSKMTDVPGHTIGIVKYLHKNGIRFLHIGVNGVSAIPGVPEMFLWRDGEHEVIVSYSDDYGGIIEVPFIEEKMIMMQTHDNSGPGSKSDILNYMEELRKEYTDYKIVGSSMDEYANILWEHRDNLPIVEEEIGDTWIHGVTSDPTLVRYYKNFTNMLKEESVDENALFDALLIPEHTWGLDLKTYLGDYANMKKIDFQKARLKDNITDADLLHHPAFNDVNKRSYKTLEASWKEKRNNINNVYKNLNEKQVATLNEINKIPRYEINNNSYKVGELIQINDYKLKVAEDGSINYLVKNDITYFDEYHPCGILNYTISGIDDYDNFRNNYLRSAATWRCDLLKLGMESQIPVQLHKTSKPFINKIEVVENKLLLDLEFNVGMCEEYGAPRKITLCYTFLDTVTFEVILEDKDAIRLSEIISINFNLNISNLAKLKMQKLGTLISPLNVVANGNKMQHVIEELVYDGCDKKIKIIPVNAPLCSFGSNNNLNFQKYYNPVINDVHFILLNTTWSTNFTMWYEENIYAKFEFMLD